VTHESRSVNILVTPPWRVSEEIAQLDFDDAGHDVGTHQHEVATVRLDCRSHEVNQRIERLESTGSFVITKFWHCTILPRREPNVPESSSRYDLANEHDQHLAP